VKIADFSVRNYQFTVVLFTMLAALGVSSWLAIPRAEDPTFPAPIFTVVAVYPGANPTDIEQLVADPIEDRIQELDDLDEMRTSIRDGVAAITVVFDPDADEDRKYDAVVRELNALRAQLPGDLYSLDVKRGSSADVNILQLALVSEVVPYHELEFHAKKLEERLEAVSGVRGAERWGSPAREVRVSLDLGRLAQLGIAPGRVLAALGSDNINIPGGSVDAGIRRFNVKTRGSYRTIDEVRATVIAGTDAGVVHVGDVAHVAWDYADATHLARYNGKRAVFVTATQREGQNIGAVRDAIWADLDRFQATLPRSIALERGFDQSRNVSERLSRLGIDFAIAIALVLVTLLPLGFRASLIVMISIPLSLAMGVAMLYFTGFSINQLSIVGFVIALGLLVDDSIVVVENITRFLREGY